MCFVPKAPKGAFVVYESPGLAEICMLRQYPAAKARGFYSKQIQRIVFIYTEDSAES